MRVRYKFCISCGVRYKFCISCGDDLDHATESIGLCEDCLTDEADEFAVIHGEFPPTL